jgi:putative transposase
MRRANTFEVIPQSDEDEELLRRLLDASAALWNEINYERRENYDDPDVWDISEYRGRYGGVLGASTVQQIERKNREAWKSFFSLEKKGNANGKPGYWGNSEDGRELRTYIRNTSYSVEWGEYSRLEILVGQDLKDEYGLGYCERLRLEIKGEPNWKEFEKQGRLELFYDEQAQTFRAFQPVTIGEDHSRLAQPLASEEAALDIGANNLVSCTTTTGKQYLYKGRDLFDRFRETTREIARLQSLLEDGRYSSHRIRRLYDRRTKRRDHAQDALVRDLIERLYDAGVSAVYVGDLTDVLETHWSVETNAKTHNFWAFRAFVNRLMCTAEEYGMSVEVRSEAWTSQTCPNCGSTEDTTRHRDTLTCPCGFEGHADLVASESFLRRHQNSSSSDRQTRHDVSRQRQTAVTRSMARPVCLKWDNHEWLESSRSPRPSEEHTNPQVASVGR